MQHSSWDGAWRGGIFDEPPVRKHAIVVDTNDLGEDRKELDSKRLRFEGGLFVLADHKGPV